MASAERQTDAAGFTRKLAEAEAILREGMRISELDRYAYYLGRVFLWRAAAEEDEQQRRLLAKTAASWLDRELVFEPGAEFALAERAMLAGEFLGDAAGATDIAKRADSLVADADAGEWSDFYERSCRRTHLAILRRFYARRSLAYCARALAWLAGHPGPAFALHLREGTMQLELGDPSLAVFSFRSALAAGDPAEAWKAEAMLAQTLAALGDRSEALFHAKQAVAGAPPGARAMLESIQAWLANR